MELQIIQNKIYEIRGQRVMLDFDLARLYNVENRVLNQAVKRNIERFPEDFMFQLNEIEWNNMSSQFVMTSLSKRPKSALPLAFTELGVKIMNEDTRLQIELINQSLAELYIDRKQNSKPRNKIGFITKE